jgi:quinol monooxygenase YgiN
MSNVERHDGGPWRATDCCRITLARSKFVSTVIRKVVVAVVALLALFNLPAFAGDPVVVTVKVYPTPGREDELQAQYLKRVEYLRKAEPGATFRLHRSTKEPVTFLWYEIYPSKEAYENHLKVVMPAFRKEAGPTPEGVIARPSESETYIELAQ